MVSSCKGKREVLLIVLIEHCGKLGTLTADDTFVEKEINVWAEANVDASEREYWFRRFTERYVTREEVNKCVAKLKKRKAAGADLIVNGFMKNGEEGTFNIMVILYSWMWKNEYVPRRGRGGEVLTYSRKEIRLTRGTNDFIMHHRQHFCKILNDIMRTIMEKKDKTSEGQEGFRPNRS